MDGVGRMSLNSGCEVARKRSTDNEMGRRTLNVGDGELSNV